jgi:hypothetical protein
MVSSPTAHLHFGRVAHPASVFDVNALHRHLRAAGLLQDHLRNVVQIVPATLRAFWARVALPRDLAVITRELDMPVVEWLATQRIIRLALRTDDLKTHRGHATPLVTPPRSRPTNMNRKAELFSSVAGITLSASGISARTYRAKIPDAGVQAGQRQERTALLRRIVRGSPATPLSIWFMT